MFEKIAKLTCCVVWMIVLAGCGGGDDVSTVDTVDLSSLPADVLVLELAGRGEADTLRAVLEENSQLVMVRGPYERTPLHMAAMNGYNDTVKVLLEFGADPRAVDENSDDPATVAIQEGYDRTAKIIMNAADGGA